MTESYTPREFIEKINAENNGPSFDPYGVESLIQKQQQTPDSSILNRAKAEARAEAEAEYQKTPEAKIAEVKAQIEAMRQWLINDGTYTNQEIQEKLQALTVEYDQNEDRAVVCGDLNLRWLTSAEGLTLPQTIKGNLWLTGLTTAEGLTLPQSIDGGLSLDDLTTAEGLTLPQSIDRGLYLFSLTSAEGLNLPQTINGEIYLDDLTSVERNDLRAQRPDLADKIFPKY